MCSGNPCKRCLATAQPHRCQIAPPRKRGRPVWKFQPDPRNPVSVPGALPNNQPSPPKKPRRSEHHGTMLPPPLAWRADGLLIPVCVARCQSHQHHLARPIPPRPCTRPLPFRRPPTALPQWPRVSSLGSRRRPSYLPRNACLRPRSCPQPQQARQRQGYSRRWPPRSIGPNHHPRPVRARWRTRCGRWSRSWAC